MTEAGLREGVFFSSYLARHDPPLFATCAPPACTTSRRQYQADLDHSRHVAHLAGKLLASLGTAEAVPDRASTRASCSGPPGCSTTSAMAVDYDDHHKHSRYLVLADGLPGFSQRELALIAQTVRYHRKGTPELGELGALCEPGDERLLTAHAAVAALAEHLDRGRDGAIEVAAATRRGRRPRARAGGAAATRCSRAGAPSASPTCSAGVLAAR